jgi:hypothetical protein
MTRDEHRQLLAASMVLTGCALIGMAIGLWLAQ